jgi:fibronectin-binding autotransporter adhesin
MKTESFVRVLAVALLALIPLSVPAQVLFWDPDGATAGTGVSGNWDTTTTNWTTAADSGVNTVWVQWDEANFGVASNYTVTLTEPITIGNFTVTGSAGTLTVAGTSANSLTVGSPSLFNIGGSRIVNLWAPIGGTFDLSKSGNGTLNLSNANTWSGGTILNGGTVGLGVDSVSSGGVITSGPFGTGEITTIGSAQTTLSALGGPRVIHNPVTLNVQLNVSGSQPLTFTNGYFKVNGANRNISTASTADTILGGNLTDEGAAHTLTKQGTGRLVLAGTDAGFLGGITATAGTLAAGNAAPFPTNNNNIITLTGSTLDLNGFNVRLSRLSGNTAGKVLLGTNTLSIVNNGPSGQTFSGVISGTGGLIKGGTISQVLNGTNTFTGGILITEGPVYFPTNGGGSPYSLGSGPNVITITNTGSWGANVVGTSIITNKVVLANVGPSAILDPAGNATVVWDQAGQITGTGGLLRSTKGSGVVILSASNTFSGGVQMDARLLMLGNKNALGAGTLIIGNPTNPPGNAIELAATGNLTGANAVTNPTTINQSFSFNSTLTGFGLELAGPVALSSGPKIISASGSGAAHISGVISGSGGIIKDGADTLTFSANNNYSGSTTVSNGTLAFAGSGSVSSGDVIVLAGATLDASGRTDGTLTVGAAQTLRGSGTVVGTVVVAGMLAPGTSIGTLTVNGNLSLNNKALFELDRDQSPSSDLVTVNGTLNGGGTLTVTNAGASLLVAGDTFTLFSPGVSGFTSVNLPPGYSWDNQLAASGTIAVLARTFPTTPTNLTTSVTGGNLTVRWPTNYAGGWVLETSPDLLNWVTVPESRDVSSMTFPTNPNQPAVFYRLLLLQ